VRDDQPIPHPSAKQVLLKIKAVAINPVDWKMSTTGYIINNYPIVLGSDVCGEVVEVGDDVTKVSVGDLVYGCTPLNTPGFGTFAEYCLSMEICTYPVPPGWSPEVASALPLANYTAFLGLFWHDNLGLSFEQGNGETVLVWGATSSVGMSVVQLLAQTGYNVIATCSPQFNDHVMRLGASHVFNYREPNVVEEIRQFTNNQLRYIYDSVGDDKSMLCLSHEGSTSIAYTSKYSRPPGLHENAKFSSVSLGGIYGRSVEEQEFVFGNCAHLVDRLAREGKFITPELEIYQGVDQIKVALEKQKAGVSAKKVIVKISD